MVCKTQFHITGAIVNRFYTSKSQACPNSTYTNLNSNPYVDTQQL